MLATTGRKAALDELTGPGVEILRSPLNEFSRRRVGSAAAVMRAYATRGQQVADADHDQHRVRTPTAAARTRHQQGAPRK